MAPPTIVFIPGVLHQGSCFKPLIKHLEPDYQCVSESLPSCFDSIVPPKVTLADDVKYIRDNEIKPLVDAGKDVVVVMHSYGGLPGSAAVEGLDPDSVKARGGSGGVIGLVFIVAVVAPVGSNNATFWEQFAPGNSAKWVSIAPDVSHTWCEPDKAREYLYEDLQPEEAEYWIKQLRKHAAGASLENNTYSAWFNEEWKSRCRFIRAEHDRVMPLGVQEKMAPDMKVIGTVPTSHSPFLSKPVETAELVRKSIQEFQALLD